MAGVIYNRSTRVIWITAGGRKHCLAAGEDSATVGIPDADGLLLDRRPVLFDSSRTDLGGGQIYHIGAIKVCDPGSMTVTDGLPPTYELKVEISLTGFICPGDSAGYKTEAWCQAHNGWYYNTAPIGRGCA